jgi:hypothetical protein
MKTFYYMESETGLAIQVRAGQRPSEKTRDKRWIVYEWNLNRKEWCMASFPEVRWHVLSSMMFLGRGK